MTSFPDRLNRLRPGLLALALAAVPASADDAQRAALAFFEKEVRPILVERCHECHSGKMQKGGLRVDHIGYLKTGGDTGPALFPGKPGESPLIEAVRRGNPDFQMPPKTPLPDAEIAVLEKWIKIGAPWPDDGPDKLVVTTGGFTKTQRDYWFFQPVTNVKPPKAGDDWARNDIDRFIARKHGEFKLTPAPEADRRELIRRACFDLHGLPPSAAQIDAFVNDPDPKAYEKLVDDLLASPRYGERWAQHWLDLVRYAESDGYNQDAYRPTVWRYRDYVIQSFNDDKPYDQFVREQLAGDEIAPDDPNVLIATAYLRHPVYEYNLRDIRGQWEVILADMTDTTGEVFLGLSMGCARCHNHKFDPILQRDYYRFRAFFTPVHWRVDLKLATPAEKRTHDEQLAKWENATADIRAKIDALTREAIGKKVETWRRSFPEDLQAMTLKPEDEREPLERQLAGLCERQLQFAAGQFNATRDLKSDEAKKEYQALQTELKKFDKLKPKPLMEAFVATDAAAQAPPNTLDTRKGELEIPPGFPSVIAPELPEITPTESSTGRRTALADWITRPDNQLATRVIVNRVWQHHFGRGIVASANEFGMLGDPPTHPGLLDRLATKFVANGWRLKPLHREIMLSAAYRQTARREPDATIAKIDPTNNYLWRFPPRRLDAEQARDAMLAVSGELDLTPGGPSVDGSGKRRSIYTRKKRNRPDDLLSALDMPAGFASASKRQSTTTPTQALQLLNGDWVLARAGKLASHAKSVDDAWLAVLGRPPRDEERSTAKAFLENRIRAVEQERARAKESEAEPPRGLFKIGSEQERLVTPAGAREGDDFTVEAVVNLEDIDKNAETRTLVTRWNGDKKSLGWSIDITGVKSRFQPRNILVQLVGEDKNGNRGYQIVASNLRLPVKRRQHLVVQVAGSRREVRFTLRDLEAPKAAAETATARMNDLSKLAHGDYPIVLGGQSVRRTTRQWNGEIEALRVVPGRIPADRLNDDPAKWEDGVVVWRAADKPGPRFVWDGVKGDAPTNDPRLLAMTDLCQALLNSNEFFYLH